MLLLCQRDSTLRTGRSTVLTCEAEGEVFRCRVDDSVLYPEGGGQPSDHGRIGDVPVLDVQRVEGAVTFTTPRPVALGDHEVVVDWPRRFDHMQQHTAQHLLSALFADRFAAQTTSFHLGAERAHIDLSRELLAEEVQSVFAQANELIRTARPVTATVRDTLDGVRSRLLPEGVEALRVVRIDGIDDNTCGGTHVAHTGELQMVVAVGNERVRGGQGRVHFLAGGRVHDRLLASHQLIHRLQQQLSTGDPLDAVSRLQSQNKSQERQLRAVSTELATAAAVTLDAMPGPIRHLHRADADAAFLGRIVSHASATHPSTWTLMSSDSGHFVLLGPAERLQSRRAQLLERIGARGGGPPGRLQGQAPPDAPWSALLRALAEEC